MNRFKCPACGGNQYTSCDTAERGDISHRGRKGNFLPGEKEESWKTAIREKEAAKQKQKRMQQPKA